MVGLVLVPQRNKELFHCIHLHLSGTLPHWGYGLSRKLGMVARKVEDSYKSDNVAFGLEVHNKA